MGLAFDLFQARLFPFQSLLGADALERLAESFHRIGTCLFVFVEDHAGSGCLETKSAGGTGDALFVFYDHVDEIFAFLGKKGGYFVGDPGVLAFVF